jgi:Ca2+-binding EF-hand superfamily protein
MKKPIKKTITVLSLLLISNISFGQNLNDRKKPRERPSIEQILKDLDKNEDGKISLKEAKGPLKKDFKKIDKNEDGFISKKELKNAPKPERKERPRN